MIGAPTFMQNEFHSAFFVCVFQTKNAGFGVLDETRDNKEWPKFQKR